MQWQLSAQTKSRLKYLGFLTAGIIALSLILSKTTLDIWLYETFFDSHKHETDFGKAVTSAIDTIKKLDQYYSTHGSYPENIAEIVIPSTLPGLLQKDDFGKFFYQSDHTSYTINFTDHCPGTFCVTQFWYSSNCRDSVFHTANWECKIGESYLK